MYGKYDWHLSTRKLINQLKTFEDVRCTQRLDNHVYWHINLILDRYANINMPINRWNIGTTMGTMGT